MESQLKTSKKRKQSSLSSPFSGTLTRHKSQKFFFHHNRSGKARKSRAFSQPSPNSPKLSANQGLANCVKKNVNGGGGGVVVDDGDEIDHVLIKDLRARRVFSKPPKTEDLGGKIETPKFDGNDEIGKNPNLSAREKCDSGVGCQEEGLNDGDPNLSEKCVESSVDVKEGNPNLSIEENCVDYSVDLNGRNPNLGTAIVGAKDGVPIEMSPNLRNDDFRSKNSDENVQTTPPDAVVLVRQIKGSDSRSPPKRISSKGGGVIGKKGVFNSNKSLVLSPCSRLKVYKAPNSFSYRRLLPFLMDLAKEDTPNVGAPKVNPTIKIETDVEEKPLVSSSQGSVIDRVKADEKPVEIAVACEPQEANIGSKEGDKLFSSPKTNGYDAQQAVVCTPSDCLIGKSQENPVIEESQIGTPVSDDAKNGGESHDGGISFDKMESLDDISPTIESDLPATLHSPQKDPELTKESDTSNIPSQLSLDDEGKGLPLDEFKSEENAISLFHSSSNLEAVVSSDEHGFGLANGILKKNPRGCRGVCNCLNCASFRLNADKAFEFSRNQWLDAEELAMDLMKELSNVRCMLENTVNGADDNAIVPVDQVQELCRRASSAENIARCRLSQMNEDLNAHCRTRPLQRPRVKFSGSVQKKVTETTNLKR